MFLKRSVQEILRDAAISIAENTEITNFSAGSIARSIVEAIAPEIGTGEDPERVSLYDFAQKVLDEGYVSKATKESLDLIGGLFSYPRRVDEVRGEDGSLVLEEIPDDMYRYELTQVVPSMATANHAALRLALLTIQGVSDVIGKEYTHGTGSFSFLLVPQPGFDSREVAAHMDEAIDRVKSYGVRPNVIIPTDVPMDLIIKAVYHETTSQHQKEGIRFEAETKIFNYISAYEVEQQFVYNDLVQEIMNSNERIVDFEILQFYLNNEPVLLTNHPITEDERIVPQNIQVI